MSRAKPPSGGLISNTFVFINLRKMEKAKMFHEEEII